MLNWLLAPSLRYGVKRILSPWAVPMGSGTFVRRPFVVRNPKRIHLGKNVKILTGATLYPITSYAGVTHEPLIEIGDGTYIGAHVAIHAINRVSIGMGCVLSDHIYLSDSSHGLDPAGPPIMDQALSSRGPIEVGRGCFIGYRAVIMPGVTLGERCIVGANSVVTHSFPPYSVIGGVPARLLKTHHETAPQTQETAG